MRASFTTCTLDCTNEIDFFKASKSKFMRVVFFASGMSFIFCQIDWEDTKRCEIWLL